MKISNVFFNLIVGLNVSLLTSQALAVGCSDPDVLSKIRSVEALRLGKAGGDTKFLSIDTPDGHYPNCSYIIYYRFKDGSEDGLFKSIIFDKAGNIRTQTGD